MFEASRQNVQASVFTPQQSNLVDAKVLAAWESMAAPLSKLESSKQEALLTKLQTLQSSQAHALSAFLNQQWEHLWSSRPKFARVSEETVKANWIHTNALLLSLIHI